MRERFGLSEGATGLVLVAMSVAVVVAFPIAGRAAVARGSRPMVRLGGIACCAAVSLPVLAPHPLLVAAALLVLGATGATMDVSMNAHGVAVEQRLGRPILSSLHAGWALGGATGAGVAAVWAVLGVDPRIGTAAASAALVAGVLVATRDLGDGAPAAGDRTPAFTLPTRPVVLLAALCFLIMFTEGAIGSWGGILLRQDLGAAAALAALSYASLTAGMTAGRLAGDAARRRFGSAALLRFGAILTALPLGAVLLVDEPAVALAGIFCVGLGVANGVPLLFSAAGRQVGTPSGIAIGAVSSVGSLAFLVGPPAVGFLAAATSLPWALATLVPGALAVFVAARRAVA